MIQNSLKKLFNNSLQLSDLPLFIRKLIDPDTLQRELFVIQCANETKINGKVLDAGAGECQYIIYNDDVYGAGLVTKHLIDLGHTRLAYLGKRQGISNTNRLIGFRTEMQTAGLPIDERYIYHTSDGNPAGGREGAEYLLSLDEIPSGIVCYNDFLAVGVYNYLQEKGMRIPQDISVTGFDNISIAGYLSPPLTTLHQFKFELGEGAAYMMLEVLANRKREARENLPSKKVCLKGILRIRASTISFRKEATKKI